MHEVSIALGIVDKLTMIAQENNAKKIITVNLKIGKMSGIVTDSLKFVFDAIKREYPVLSSAEVLIDEVPLEYECNECKKSFEAEGIYFPSCPECKTYNLKLISGAEMNIENVELEV